MIEIATIAAVHEAGSTSAAWSSPAPATKHRRLAGHGSVRSISPTEEAGS